MNIIFNSRAVFDHVLSSLRGATSGSKSPGGRSNRVIVGQRGGAGLLRFARNDEGRLGLIGNCSKIFLLTSLLVVSTSAIADQCDSIAASVARATGATLEQKGELDPSITLRHPAIDSMNIGCTDQQGNPNGVTSWVIIGSKGWAWSGHSDGPHEAPSPKTFSLLAAATQIAFGAPFQTIATAAAKCAADAAKAENYHAQVDAAGLALDCLSGPDRISGAIAVNNPPGGK